MNMSLPDLEQARLRGWQFVLFNAVLGLAHMVVLFNAGSYVALLPHAAGDLGGVVPSFGTWAQTDFMIALALAFPIARWLSCRYGESRVFVGAFLAYAAASALCAIDSNYHDVRTGPHSSRPGWRSHASSGSNTLVARISGSPEIDGTGDLGILHIDALHSRIGVGRLAGG